jgi:Arc/MetJ family transcription regulator
MHLMLECIMRTTIAIDDQLLAQAKRLASAERLTLGEFVEEALRRALTEPRQRKPLMLPVFTGGTGMNPGIDPTSNRSLYDAMDDSGDLR